MKEEKQKVEEKERQGEAIIIVERDSLGALHIHQDSEHHFAEDGGAFEVWATRIFTIRPRR